MDLEQRFDALDTNRKLAIAAIAGERVLPLFDGDEAGLQPLRDALMLVRWVAEGRSASRVKLTAASNAVSALIPDLAEDSPAAAAVCRCVMSAVEAASHNAEAAWDSLSAAIVAVRSFGGDGDAEEERAWQRWAVRQGEENADVRAALATPDSPNVTWRTKLQRDLPLFQGAS